MDKMDQSPQRGLWKVLGTGFGIAVTLGGILGTGILRKPGEIASVLGDPYLVIGLWVLVGIYAILGISCILELSLSIPRAGAWYVYAERAFGPYTGFLVGLSSWFGTVSAMAFGAYTLSEYLALLFPVLSEYLIVTAAAMLVLLWGFHQIGVVSGGRSQEILSGIKAFALFAFIFLCWRYGEGGAWSQTTPVPSGRLLVSGIITALLSIFYAYDGWHTAAYFTEENRNPEKSLPKSMYWGIALVILIYLSLNIVILYTLPFETLSTSKLAAADAMKWIFGPETGKWVTVFLALSIFGILNAEVMFAPRVIYSMAVDKIFWKKATRVNRGGSPSVAIHLTVLAAIIILVGGRKLGTRLSDVATFFFVASYLSGFASLIKLRKKEPDLRRPYKAWLYPGLPWTLLLVSAGFLVGTLIENRNTIVYLLIYLALSYPGFLLVKKNR
jgi:APA family basic amino acid/polyamine antiporter